MISKKQLILFPRMIEIIRNAPQLGFHAVFKLNTEHWVEEDVYPVSDCLRLFFFNIIKPILEPLIFEVLYRRYEKISGLS